MMIKIYLISILFSGFIQTAKSGKIISFFEVVRQSQAKSGKVRQTQSKTQKSQAKSGKKICTILLNVNLPGWPLLLEFFEFLENSLSKKSTPWNLWKAGCFRENLNTPWIFFLSQRLIFYLYEFMSLVCYFIR